MKAYPLVFTKKKNKRGKMQHRWSVPCTDNGELIGCISESMHDRQEAEDNAYRLYISLKAYFESDDFKIKPAAPNAKNCEFACLNPGSCDECKLNN